MKRLCAVVLVAVAATAAPPALVVNGHVDEAFWGGAALHSLGPEGGDVRAAVAGGYLYVAATLPEPGGRVTARSVGRNPVWENQDTLRIAAGERILLVNPFGAYSVEQLGPVVLSSAETYQIGRAHV